MPDDPLEALARLLGETGKDTTIRVTSSAKDLSQTSGKKAPTCGLTISVDIAQGGPQCQGALFTIKLGNPAGKIAPATREGGAWSVTRTPRAPTK